MDKEYEGIIVKNFFVKRVQDRVLYELSSKKKRSSALDRLCHDYRYNLNERYLIQLPKPNSDYNEIVSLLNNYGAVDYCYAISFNKDIDGKHLPLIDALEKAVGFGMPSLISCIPNKLAYFEAEQLSGPPERFIIKKEYSGRV